MTIWKIIKVIIQIVYSSNTALVLNVMLNRLLKRVETNNFYNYNTHWVNGFNVNRVSDTFYQLGKQMIETEFSNIATIIIKRESYFICSLKKIWIILFNKTKRLWKSKIFTGY